MNESMHQCAAPSSGSLTRRKAVGMLAAIVALPLTNVNAAVGIPTISSPYLSISVDAGSNLATVSVRGTMRFSEYNRNQMKQGIQYAVTCEVLEEDDPPGDSDDSCFVFGATGSPKSLYFPKSRSNPASSEVLSFSQRVSADKLDQDDNNWTRNFQDEVYAELIIWASDGSGWEWVKTVRTNRIDRRF